MAEVTMLLKECEKQDDQMSIARVPLSFRLSLGEIGGPTEVGGSA